uniref:Uncharacterized protein n=1 Tax=Colobus angolensis palliatus TaxID=336983 RepID=A0A2K5KB77_COLAP
MRSLRRGRSLKTSRAYGQRWRPSPRNWRSWTESCASCCWRAWRGCCGTSWPCEPWRRRWSRARALGQWSPWTVQQVLSWSAWCWNPECWCRNLPSPLSTCWGH